MAKEYTKDEIIQLLKEHNFRIWVYDIDKGSRIIPNPYSERVKGIIQTFDEKGNEHFAIDISCKSWYDSGDWHDIEFFNKKWAVDPDEFELSHKGKKAIKLLKEAVSRYDNKEKEVSKINKQIAELKSTMEDINIEQDEIIKNVTKKLTDMDLGVSIDEVLNNYHSIHYYGTINFKD